MERQNIVLAVTVIILAVVGTLIFELGFNGQHRSILGLTAFSMGAIVFFGSLKDDSSSTLRKPIAITLVVTYLYLMSSLIFIDAPEESSSVADAFIQSFTAIVGVVIAFYFGAVAAEEIARIRAQG